MPALQPLPDAAVAQPLTRAQAAAFGIPARELRGPLWRAPLRGVHEWAFADVLDEETGLIAEYDGAGHREERRHATDNVREELLEAHGMTRGAGQWDGPAAPTPAPERLAAAARAAAGTRQPHASSVAPRPLALAVLTEWTLLTVDTSVSRPEESTRSWALPAQASARWEPTMSAQTMTLSR